VAANLSIGEDTVVNFRTQLTPSMSCICSGGIRKKSFQYTEFHFDTRDQKFSRWKVAKFAMNYLAVGETWLFVSLSGLQSTFYGVTKIHISRLQKFRRVCESLNISLHNEDDVMVRMRGSFCWKIYNEEFDGPAPISSSPPRSIASVSDSDRITSIKLEPTLNELRSYYESYLFRSKSLELKLIEKNVEAPMRDNKVASGSDNIGYKTESTHTQYFKPSEVQQQNSNNSQTQISLQIGSTEDSQDTKRSMRVRQIVRVIDLISKKYQNSNHLLSILCPLCTKPVKCFNKSPSREVKNIPYEKDTLSRDLRSWSSFGLLD